MDWNKELKENWEKGINGNYQTAHFISQVLANIDMRHYEKLDSAKRLLDYGCAMGQAAKILGALFPKLKILCYDKSDYAMEKIKENSLEVISSMPKKLRDEFDVIYCSNTIEHFDNLNLCEFEAKEMTIFLVPYDQNLQGWPGEPVPEKGNTPGGHTKVFSRKDFPKQLGSLERTVFKPIKETVKNMGTSDQLLVIYEKFDEQTKKDIAFEKKQVEERFDYLDNRLI
jgi:SAM-dependent methyltransferase